MLGRWSVTIISTASTLGLVWLNKFETNRNDRNFGFNNKQAARGTFSCTLPIKVEINCNNERNVAFTGTYMVTNRKKHASVTVSMSPMLL